MVYRGLTQRVDPPPGGSSTIRQHSGVVAQAGGSILTGSGRSTVIPQSQSIIQAPTTMSTSTLPTIKPGFFGAAAVNKPTSSPAVGSAGDATTLAGLLAGVTSSASTPPAATRSNNNLTPAAISKLITAAPSNKNNCNENSWLPTAPTKPVQSSSGPSEPLGVATMSKATPPSLAGAWSSLIAKPAAVCLSLSAAASDSPAAPRIPAVAVMSGGVSRGLNQSLSVVSDDGGEADVSNPDPQFEAIVTLPESVELVTGEEDETEMFADRAKLYRFSDQQWKERGVGIIKILHNENTRKARIVMRRDQIHKVCANHYIRSDMLVDVKSPSDKKVLTWRATDLSDGQPIIEQFCARFKTDDVAALFVQKFNEAVELISKSSNTTSAPVSGKELPESSAGVMTTNSSSSVQLATGCTGVKSLPTGGSGSVPSVVTSTMAAPTAPQSSAVPSTQATSTPSGSGSKGVLTASKFSFQSSKSDATTSVVSAVSKPDNMSFGGFTFSSPAVVQKPTADLVPKSDVSTSKPVNPFASFSFVKPSTQADSKSTTPAAGDKPVFGQLNQSATSSPQQGISVSGTNQQQSTAMPFFGSSSTLSFASLAADGASGKQHEGFAVKIPESKVKSNAFQQAGQQLFSSSSPAPGAESIDSKKGSVKKESVGEDDDGGEYEPSLEFTPLVSLPEVTVVTGEESETKIYGERAKLYRLDSDTKQWKERGVGELKIMKNFTTGQSRIVMRREQVLKLCANHRISSTMKLLPMTTSETSWLWYAQDFAEGEMRAEQLCAKFKNSEQAQQFYQCFEKCVEEAAGLTQQECTTEIKLSRDQVNKSGSVDSKESSEASEVKPLSEMFKANAGEWECSGCYVRNKPTTAKCVACDTPRQGAASGAAGIEPTAAAAASKPTAAAAVPSVQQSSSSSGQQSLSSLFKKQEGEWECGGCYLKNKDCDLKCAACETVRPGATLPNTTAIGPVTSTSTSSSGQQSLSSLFKKQEGEWECGGCYLKNKDCDGKCAACETVRPCATLPNTTATGPVTSTSTDSTVKFGAQGGFTFSGTAAGTNLFSGFGQHGSLATGGFKSGASSTPVIKSASTQSLAGDASAVTGGFKFAYSGSFTFGAGKSADSSELNVSSSSQQQQQPGGSSQPTFKLGSTPLLRDALTSKIKQSSSSLTPAAGDGFVFGSSSTTAASGIPVFSFTPKPSTDSIGPAKPLAAAPSTPKSSIAVDKFTFTGCRSPAASYQNPFSTSTPVRAGGQDSSTGVVFESPDHPQDDNEELYRNSEDEDDSHIQFEPIIKLPEKVDLTTGEEDEDVVYESRAKLYRYADNTWKERGIGTIKLLHRRIDGTEGRVIGQTRLVMRREQVLKLCLNHLITVDTKLHEMLNSEGKAWTWHADDYSEGQLSHERFAIRFKTAEIANDFKYAVEKARQARENAAAINRNGSKTAGGGSKLAQLLTHDDNDDIEVVSVELPDDHLVSQARRFLLPDGFYMYMKSARPCQGCIGCEHNEDKFIFSSSSSALATDQSSSRSNTLAHTSADSSTVATSMQSFTSVTSQPVFGGKPVFDAGNQSLPLFGGTSSTTQQSLFGSSSSTSGLSFTSITTNQPVFGAANLPIFGAANQQPVFGAANQQPVFGAANQRPVFGAAKLQPVFGAAKLQQQPKVLSSEANVSQLKTFSFNAASDKPSSLEPVDLSGKSEPPTASSTVSSSSNTVMSGTVNISSATTLGMSSSATTAQAPAVVKGEQEEMINVVDDDDDDDERPLFCRRATLFYVVGENNERQKAGLVDVRITVDSDVSGLRIVMKPDSGEVLCNHIICRGYMLERLDKRSCEWKAKDFRTNEPQQTVFYVEFSSPNALEEFHKCFKQGVDMAQQSDLDESKDESSLYLPTNGGVDDSGGESQ